MFSYANIHEQVICEKDKQCGFAGCTQNEPCLRIRFITRDDYGEPWETMSFGPQGQWYDEGSGQTSTLEKVEVYVSQFHRDYERKERERIATDLDSWFDSMEIDPPESLGDCNWGENFEEEEATWEDVFSLIFKKDEKAALTVMERGVSSTKLTFMVSALMQK